MCIRDSAMAEGILMPYAAFASIKMVSAFAVTMSTLGFKKYFTKEEQEAGMSTWILGLAGITEGAIPVMMADPVRVKMCIRDSRQPGHGEEAAHAGGNRVVYIGEGHDGGDGHAGVGQGLGGSLAVRLVAAAEFLEVLGLVVEYLLHLLTGHHLLHKTVCLLYTSGRE